MQYNVRPKRPPKKRPTLPPPSKEQRKRNGKQLVNMKGIYHNEKSPFIQTIHTWVQFILNQRFHQSAIIIIIFSGGKGGGEQRQDNQKISGDKHCHISKPSANIGMSWSFRDMQVWTLMIYLRHYQWFLAYSCTYARCVYLQRTCHRGL